MNTNKLIIDKSYLGILLVLFLILLLQSVLATNYKNCEEIYYNGYNSGYYDIYPDGSTKINVYCSMTNGHGWTITDLNHDANWLNFFRWV